MGGRGGDGGVGAEGGVGLAGEERERAERLEKLKKEVGLELDRWDYSLDAGRSWGVLAASFFCMATFMGFLTGFGIFVRQLEVGLGVTTTAASFAGGLCTGVASFAVLPGTALYNIIGCRVAIWLGAWTLTLGLLSAAFATTIGHFWASLGVAGLGIGFQISSMPGAQTEYFLRFRRLALGLVFTGAAFGTLAAPRLFLWAVPGLGWRSALLVYSGVASLLVVSGTLIRSRRPKNLRFSPAEVVHCQLWRQLDFHLIVVHGMCWGGSIDVFFLLVNRVVDARGLTDADVANVLLAIGITNAAARITSSFLSQQPWLPLLPYYTGMTALWAACIGLFALPRSLPVFIALGIAFGLGFGAMMAIATAVQLKLFGPAHLPSAFGMSCIFVGLGKMGSSSLAGWIVEGRGTGRGPEAAVGYLCAVGLGAAVTAAILAVRDRRRSAVAAVPDPIPPSAAACVTLSSRHPSIASALRSFSLLTADDILSTPVSRLGSGVPARPPTSPSESGTEMTMSLSVEDAATHPVSPSSAILRARTTAVPTKTRSSPSSSRPRPGPGDSRSSAQSDSPHPELSSLSEPSSSHYTTSDPRSTSNASVG